MMPDYTELLSQNSVDQRSEHKEIYPGNNVLNFTSILGVPSACMVVLESSGTGRSGIHPIDMDRSGTKRLASRFAYRHLVRWFISRPVCQPQYLPNSRCSSPIAAIVTAELTLFSFCYSNQYLRRIPSP